MNESNLSNQPQNEIEMLLQAARDALTDSMVERLAETGANTLEVVNRLNDEDTKDAVLNIVDRVTELHRLGALDTLFDLVLVLHSARDALTDSMIERLFGFVEQMVNTLANEDIANLADDTRLALDAAVAETAAAAPKGGVWATLSMLSSPESQRSLSFLLSFGAQLRQRSMAARGTSDG